MSLFVRHGYGASRSGISSSAAAAAVTATITNTNTNATTTSWNGILATARCFSSSSYDAANALTPTTTTTRQRNNNKHQHNKHQKYHHHPAASAAVRCASRLTRREDLVLPSRCKRVIVKVGSAVLTREDECGLALGRLASIVEQLAELQLQGREMILVTSGAVAFGKQLLHTQNLLSRSLRQTLRGAQQQGGSGAGGGASPQQSVVDPRACSAAGQGGLVGLYQSLFQQYGISCAQVLVTKNDFRSRQTVEHLSATMDELMRMNVIPIINENDAISPPGSIDADLEGVLSVTDNDSLAANVAARIDADLMILLSDVDGIYSAPPGSPHARLLDTYRPSEEAMGLEFGAGSKVGRGGMEAKVDAAAWAWGNGTAVVVANGMRPGTIVDVTSGKTVGTLFTDQAESDSGAETMATQARAAGRSLALMPAADRARVLNRLADLLLEREADILAANEQDLTAGRASGLAGPLLGRLKLTRAKLEDLAVGLRQIAEGCEGLLGKCVRKTQISEEMLLEQVTTPLGVLMVIFESRPDCLVQIAGLAIASGNGLMLKGGKEALVSNRCLHALVQEALAMEEGGDPDKKEAVQLLVGREIVADMLATSGAVDLIIPRGSNELVAAITEAAGGVPVMGHADGVCHVYIDASADLDVAKRIVVESKIDYPSACNAMETLLIDTNLVTDKSTDGFAQLGAALKDAGVRINLGPRLAELLPMAGDAVASLHVEYGDLECTVEAVDGVAGAIDHINTHGSAHTDVVVSQNQEIADAFLAGVDSACVFHNASSRFADGFRFGLGAEVGISTGRIHARGPVGVDGLLTTKWRLTTSSKDGAVIADFAEGGKQKWLHNSLPTDA